MSVKFAAAAAADPPPEPWVLYVTLAYPHPPFEVEEPWFSMHDRAAMREELEILHVHYAARSSPPIRNAVSRPHSRMAW